MASEEALVLDGLAVNDGVTFMLISASITPPAKRPEWISGADSHGALLARDPLHENRIIEAHLAVMPQTTMDLALAKIALLVDKFEECERNTNGLALTWVPADATLTAVTFRCLSGEITDMPISWEGGWFSKSPELGIRLTCLPFWEGIETLVASVTSSAPLITLELTGITGDQDALGRLVVTDAASQSRRYVPWGLESRYYPTSSPPSLIVDSSGMVTSGFAGTTATRTAAYSSATNNVITSTLRTRVQAICGLGNLAHVGQFRPQLRFYASDTTIAVRLKYQALEGPFRSLSYKIPVAVGFNSVDLGLITIPTATMGTQRWTGRIEAYSTAAGGETFEVDAIWMMPAEQFGRARATYAYEPGVLVAYDEFTGRTTGDAITVAAAPSGGSWVESGAAGGFLAVDGPGAGEETVARAASSTGVRLALLGLTNYTNIEVGHFVQADASATAVGPQMFGQMMRYVDSANYLFVGARSQSPVEQFCIGVRVANVPTYLAAAYPPIGLANRWWDIRAVCFSSGVVIAQLRIDGGIVLELRGFHAALKTGGALQTGRIGIYDDALAFTYPANRYYDNFYAATPPAEPLVVNSGQSIEFRHDGVVREDSTGTYWGPPPEYVGTRFTVPCAGGPARKTRVAVMARRNDVESAADDDLASNATMDSTTVQVYATPRGLVVPR